MKFVNTDVEKNASDLLSVLLGHQTSSFLFPDDSTNYKLEQLADRDSSRNVEYNLCETQLAISTVIAIYIEIFI